MAGLDAILAQSLEVVLDSGDVTPLAQPHSTGWRTLPWLVCSNIQRGRSRMELDYDTRLSVPTGSLVVLPAGVHHHIKLLTPTGHARWVHLRYSVLGGLDLFALLEIDPVLPPALGTACGEVIGEWMARRDHLDGPLQRAASVRAFGFHLLELLAPVCRERPEAPRRLELLHRLRPVIDHLHRDPAGPCGRNHLAAMAGMPPATFHRAFRACIGGTPVGYMRRLRLQAAQRLLLTGSLSVADIARRCGYDDPFVFSRTFRDFCGVSPRQYRQTTARPGP